MSDHMNKENFFLDEDDLRDYEEYKKSHSGPSVTRERSGERLPWNRKDSGKDDTICLRNCIVHWLLSSLC